MKKLLAVILTALLLSATCMLLTGCDSPKVRVESVMTINKDFKGSRTITVVYPLNAAIDAIKDDILEENPVPNVEGAKFSYLGATEDGYTFELKLTFDNLSAYEEQVGAVIGRDANAVLARKSSVMFEGTRMQEDFDLSELVGWIERDTKATESTKDYTFEYPVNKVTVEKDTFDTGSTVKINEGTGIPISSVEIKTYNERISLLSRLFDRSFVFAIPADTYSEQSRRITGYFEEIAGENASFSDTHEGNNVLYTVTFEGLSLSDLETTTAAMLDSDGVSVFYGDKDNRLSTPLYEGRVLEETLDTLSFIGKDDAPPALKYTYSLQTNSVKGEGAIYKDGGWQDAGTWDDGAYRLTDDSGLTHLRIYDGRQYVIKGVRFDLKSLGDGTFRRTTSFLYPVEDGFEGPVYATKFFQSKGGETSSDNDGDYVICSVTSEGNVDELNEALENIFGKGNYLSYDRKDGALSDKTTLTDYIDLRQVLNLESAITDMTYTMTAENGENIVTVLNGDTETGYSNKDDSAVTVHGCVATVGYHGVVPKGMSILFYILFGVLLFGITTLAAYRMLVPPIRRERKSKRRRARGEEIVTPPQELPEQADVPSYAPQQTTTFSIFELGILSRNKKVVDEINRDVEKRLDADRLKERKKELRRRELQEMEKKVYGKEADEKPADDEPQTQEMLDTFDRAMKAEPEAPAPTDPMELLDLVNGEDQDD